MIPTCRASASPNWNNSGFMRNVIEAVQVTAV